MRKLQSGYLAKTSRVPWSRENRVDKNTETEQMAHVAAATPIFSASFKKRNADEDAQDWKKKNVTSTNWE